MMRLYLRVWNLFQCTSKAEGQPMECWPRRFSSERLPVVDAPTYLHRESLGALVILSLKPFCWKGCQDQEAFVLEAGLSIRGKRAVSQCVSTGPPADTNHGAP